MSNRNSAAVNDLAAILEMNPDILKQWVDGASALFAACHYLSKQGGWWHDPATGEPLKRNKGEMICLMHSELSEMMEAERKNLMDEKLPHRLGSEVEMSDAMIRMGDYAGGFGLDPIRAMVEKMVYNYSRADHKPENRLKAGGKSF